MLPARDVVTHFERYADARVRRNAPHDPILAVPITILPTFSVGAASYSAGSDKANRQWPSIFLSSQRAPHAEPPGIREAPQSRQPESTAN